MKDIAAELNTVISWVPADRQGPSGDRPDGPGLDRGPLAGLRIGVKDNIEVAGVASTCASEYYRGWVAPDDAEVVRRLKDAGAAITCTLNMAEFAIGVTSQNSAFGGPRNPWSADRVPGGSSGGSGVAVAAGIVDVALGTDTGGSIRLPATCCGVTGLRPSTGAISARGVFPVSADFDTVGPLARSAVDVRRVFEVLAGRSAQPNAGPLRVAVPRPFITDDVDAAILSAVDDFVAWVGDAGHDVVDREVPGAKTAQDIVYTLIYADLARTHAERLTEKPGRFVPATRERIALGLEITENRRRAAQSARSDFRRGMEKLFDDVDLVITPTMPVDVPPVEGGDAVVALARRMGQLTYPWSLHAGPTLSLPIGFHPESGMPIGAQITAAPEREDLLFSVAEAYQQVTDWHLRLPPVHVGS